MLPSFLTFQLSRRFLVRTGIGIVLVALGLTLVLVRNHRSDAPSFTARTARAVVSDYVDHAVLKTIEQLVAEVDQLHETATELQRNPSAENYASVVSAWQAAYGAWQQTAVYLYGPAAQYDYWKKLATWPCEKVLIEHALDQVEAGKLTVDSRYLREEQVAALRGFYTLQYLLFQNGKPRAVSSMRAVEMDYLAAVTLALLEESIDFEAAWRGTNQLTTEKRARLEKAGFDRRDRYAEEFKNPGSQSSRYASLSIVLQEVFQDLSGVLEDEVVPGVAELLEGESSGVAAYWEGLDPFADVLNLLQGAENAYLGGIEGFRQRAIADLVAAQDPALDRLIKISLAHTAYRIKAVQAAQGDAYAACELAVRIASAEAEKLVARLAVAIPQVILDPAVEPYAAYVK